MATATRAIRAVLVAVAAAVAGAPRGSSCTSTAGSRWFFLGGLAVGTARCSCHRDAMTTPTRRLSAAVRARRDVPAHARHSGLVELRDAARQRHRLLRRAGAARCCPAARGGERFQAPRWRARAHYFNAHPYLAAVAVGALARAELDGEPPARIERFRTALCGPLGSVGDRLVWAGWLPFCSLVALARLRTRRGPVLVVALFLVLYNVGHFGLRAWGLAYRLDARAARRRLRSAIPCCATARSIWRAPRWRSCGLALPLAAARISAARRSRSGTGDRARRARAGVAARDRRAARLALVRLHGRVEGWRLALVVLALFAPLLGGSLMAGTHRPDREQERAARSARPPRS